MKKPFFAGKKAVVIGLKRSGIGACSLLLKYGCQVTGVDAKPREALEPGASTVEKLGARIVCGPGNFQIPPDVDIVVPSPGVPLYSPLLVEAMRLGKDILGELEIAFSVLECQSVCVTGTNGKSTCVNLIGEILSDAGKKAVVAGNIGLALSTLADSLDKENVAVVEVSSFQLETVKTMRPDVGVILNVTPDHLDRHKTLEEYLRLKMRLFENQRPGDIAVLNSDDEVLAGAAAPGNSRVLRFGTGRTAGEGAGVENGILKVGFGGKVMDVIPVEEISIKGPHNLSNAMAAVCAAVSLGISPDSIRKTLTQFKGLPHRLENVGSLAGVLFVNDSKATNVDALRQALLSFTSPLVLIAGGRDKDGNFNELLELARKHVKHVVLIGEAAGKIRGSWPGVSSSEAGSMDGAVEAAFESAEPGDVVLLSPGCASYDMFRDFEDRGEKFAGAFLSLKKKLSTGRRQ